MDKKLLDAQIARDQTEEDNLYTTIWDIVLDR